MHASILCILLGVCNSRLLCVLQPLASIFCFLAFCSGCVRFSIFGLCICILLEKMDKQTERNLARIFGKKDAKKKEDTVWDTVWMLSGVCIAGYASYVLFVVGKN